jgi:hypothetical protein
MTAEDEIQATAGVAAVSSQDAVHLAETLTAEDAKLAEKKHGSALSAVKLL